LPIQERAEHVICWIDRAATIWAGVLAEPAASRSPTLMVMSAIPRHCTIVSQVEGLLGCRPDILDLLQASFPQERSAESRKSEPCSLIHEL